MKKFLLLALFALSTQVLCAGGVEEINAATNTAPGLFSQALKLNRRTDVVFVSGQLPFVEGTKELVKGDIRAQAARIIDQIEAHLVAGGSDLQHVLRVEIFLKDLKDFQAVNEVYAERFKSAVMPTRQTIQVADLPFGSPIEISCIGYVPAPVKADKQAQRQQKSKKHSKHDKSKADKKVKSQKKSKDSNVKKCVMPKRKKGADVAPAKDKKAEAPATE